MLILTTLLTGLGSIAAGVNLSLPRPSPAMPTCGRWALLFAALGIVATGFSLRTSVVPERSREC